MNLGVASLGALVLFAISASNWRRSVKIALALVIAEGAIRKWVLPQASDLVYFLKDIVLLGAYARYYIFDQTSRPPVASSTMKALLWIATLIISFQVLNLRLASVAIGLFGFKAYLWYVPLCFMLRDLFRSSEELQTFLKWYLLLAIPVGGLGAIQFFSPPNSPINTYVAGEENIATFGNAGEFSRARITGTFSYISGYTAYLTVSQALLFAMLASKLKKLWLGMLMGALVVLTGNIFMTGSRGPVLSGVIVFAGFLFFSQLSQKREVRKGLAILLLTAVICVVASMYWFGEAMDAFWQRATDADNTSERVTSTFLEPLEHLSGLDIVGYGAGATHPGGATLRARFGLPDPAVAAPEAENETVRVMLELGVLGFLVWYAIKLYLILALWRTKGQVQDPFLKNLALAAFLAHSIQLTGTTVLNHTSNVYFWFMAGFIFLLPRLDTLIAHRDLLNNTGSVPRAVASEVSLTSHARYRSRY